MKWYTWDALFNAIVLSIFVTSIMQWGARAKQMYNHFNTGWAGISINGTLFIFVSWMCQQFTLHCNRKNRNGIYALHILRDWVCVASQELASINSSIQTTANQCKTLIEYQWVDFFVFFFLRFVCCFIVRWYNYRIRHNLPKCIGKRIRTANDGV